MSWSFTISGHAADAPTEQQIRNTCADLARNLANNHPGTSEGSSFDIVEKSTFSGSHDVWYAGDETRDPVRLEKARQIEAPADQALRDKQAASDTAQPPAGDGD